MPPPSPSPEPTPTPSPRASHAARLNLMRLLLTALGYALTGALGLMLVAVPGQPTPLYPAAGVALACVLVWGRRVAPMVLLMSFLLNLALVPFTLSWQGVLTAFFISLGAALQALCGAWLVKRFVRHPLTLSEPRDVALFFLLGAVLACLISATTGTLTLHRAGSLADWEQGVSWITWWTGDALGVMLGAPITLSLIGLPRHEWRPRRLSVGLTLAVATVVLAFGLHHVLRLDRERTISAFGLDATSAVAHFRSQLQQPLNALEAMRSAHVLADHFSRDQFQDISGRWLRQYDQLLALGWSERLKNTDVPGFEERARSEGVSQFRVHARTPGAADSAAIPAQLLGDDLVVIRYVEPMARNQGALGFNSWSMPQARQAIVQSAVTDQPVASAPFALVQDTTTGSPGVVIYHAVYRGQPLTEEERLQDLRGVVFATLRMDDFVRVVRARVPEYMKLCIVDIDAKGQRSRLTGMLGCEGAVQELMHSERVSFAGRQWELRLAAQARDVGAQRSNGTQAMSLVALVCAGMLGALLLTVTGRTGRIEEAVNQRTAALVQEVRDRERAEDALRESEQRFRNIFNIVPIAVAYADLHGKLKQVNPRFCELVGYTMDELLSMNAFDFTHPDEAQEDVVLSSKLVRGEMDVYRRTTRYIQKHGGTVSVQSTVSLLRDAAGRPRRIVSAVEDISEHLRLDEAERAREAAEAANEAKSEFLSRMSHELRTPLNAMLGFAQLLEMDLNHPLAPSQRPWVNQIQQAGWHLLEMINEVLDLSRIESGNLQLYPQPLHLPTLLAATLPMVERDAQRHGITISQKIHPDAVHFEGDATRVKQILTNLLSNAVKYNTERGTIHITAQRAGERVKISVTDTGLGMTPDQVKDLFQPFNRLGRDHSTVEGTGIGLVISQRLAELMGGRLKVKSTPRKGTTFTLSLPALNDVGLPPSALASVAPLPPDYNQRIIHYIEDNETNIEVMRGILSLRPQVRLDVSCTGEDGLASIRHHKPDVVLLDMHLPDMNGLEILGCLKADPATALIPVMIVSADAVASQINEVLSAGAVRYLTKPVSVAELLAAVDAVLEEAETRFGNLDP
ncbi:MAG: CHASE domain-containing protein [Pseudomonadota bacterium]